LRSLSELPVNAAQTAWRGGVDRKPIAQRRACRLPPLRITGFIADDVNRRHVLLAGGQFDTTGDALDGYLEAPRAFDS